MKNKKFTLVTIVVIGLLFLISMAVSGQDSIKNPAITLGDQLKLKISGFLRSDIFYDTRRNVEKVDGLFSILPLNSNYDLNNKDINDINIYRMTAAASRLATKFIGTDLGKAKTSAYIEFDFTGFNGVGLNLRHAYVKLVWPHSELLFGRYFHPMFNVDIAPTVLGINSGSPFLIYGRNEQLRYNWKPGILNFMVAASALMNYGFASDGNGGYQHYQTIPDLTGNIQLAKGLITMGLSGNFKLNQPKLFTSKISNKNYQTSETVHSYTLMTYLQIKTGKLILKGSMTYAQSNCELNMLGGYAVKTRDTTSMKETYATINNINYWGNIVYGTKLQVCLFLGYSQNLGTSIQHVIEIQKDVARGFDASGNGVDHLYRISPSIAYKIGQLLFTAEIEYTVAAYGKYDINNHLKVNNTKNIPNTRSMFTTLYFF